MLLVQHIRENYHQVLLGLQKRNLSQVENTLQQVLALDDKRKACQTQRDQLQAESNAISKEIGMLMKEGKQA
ncbi:MAG: serine--tRNA ligase, partial [Chitinophagia bacterium]|nr:serine--tRNA ligase [Chitinophagia bacterium]